MINPQLLIFGLFSFLFHGYLFPQQNEAFETFALMCEKAESFYEVSKWDSATKYFTLGIEAWGKIEEKEKNDSLMIPVLYMLGELYERNGELETAVSYASEALKLCEKYQSPEEAKILITLANTYEDLGEYEKGLEYYLRLLPLLKKENSPQYRAYLAYTGFIYNRLFYHSKAAEYYSTALPLFYEANEMVEYGKCLLNLGKTKDWLGDRPGGLDFLLKALEVAKNVGDEALLVDSYYYLGVVYNNLYKFDLAIENFEMAFPIYEKLNMPDNVADCLALIGISYGESGQYEKSLYYFHKGLQIRKRASGDSDPYLINDYLDIAQGYEYLNEKAKASEYYEKALDLSNIYPGHRTRSTTLYRVGNFLTRLSKADRSLPLFQEMIRMEIPDYTETDPLKHPDFQAEPKAKITYIVALDEKAKALRVKGNGQADYLMAADTCYQIVLNQIEQIRKGFRSEETKLEIQQQAREFYTRALENCLDLYQLTGNKGYLNRAFSISEKSKTAALYEGIQMSKLRQSSNVPMEILETETRIRVNIHRLEENIFELENQETEEDSSLLARYWAEKYFLQQKHDSILLFLEKSHPDFDLKSHQQTIISPTAIQAKLTQKQAFITYYLTDSVLHGFVITDGDFQYFSKKLKSNFSQELWDYREILTNPNPEADVYPFSNYLYRILIEPVIEQIDEKNLIIAPDGILSTLPFETLITKLPGKDLQFQKHLNFF
ncbi:MAG: tetratricopeptide repeat protein [Bacteroidia bacterium]